MGYEVHIIKRHVWEDCEEDSKISLQEWLTYVQSDDELELTNGYQENIPGVDISFKSIPGFCLWTGHTTKVNEDKPRFDYWRGTINVKYPDDETILKMIAIANKLNCKVQGDDGEFYDENYFPISPSNHSIYFSI